MHHLSALFAQAAPAAQPQPGSDIFSLLLFLLPLFLIFYWFFMLRPQQKQEEKHRKTIDSLEKNDKVMTVGGIIGSVFSVDKEANEITLKVDDGNNTKIRFHITAIHTVFPKDNGEKNDKK